MNYKEFVLATNNKGKLREYEELFLPIGIKVHSLNELNINIDVNESGSTYEENSYLKAKAISRFTNLPVIADDSGIEIPSLGKNYPGIYSARFATSQGGYPAVFDVINEKLKNKDRSAAYRCCICFLENSDATPLFFEGKCEGYLLEKPLGENGFGYDPIFHCIEGNIDFGICSDEEKNHYSHRYKALRKFIEYLSNNSKYKS